MGKPLPQPAERVKTDTEWFLRGAVDASGSVWRTCLRPLPFQVGRREDMDLRLSSTRVSQRHAEFFLSSNSLWLRDLASTNGTFVNGEQVLTQQVTAGDILHFGDLQFRLEAAPAGTPGDDTMRISPTGLGLTPRQVRLVKSLVELMRTQAVRAEFQPIVRLADGAVFAYEALGRGELAGAPSAPGELLEAAEALGLAADLSALFRERQLAVASSLPNATGFGRPVLFVNTHPAEVEHWEKVLDSLRAFRSGQPAQPLVLEIHESAVTDLATFRDLRRQLDALNVEQAFDDFGTGAARLEELCDASPDYVKFDLNFARDLHLASTKRRDMVRSLVRMMLEMGIRTIIEGVENADEASACRDLGFDCAQGYHFGRPRPLDLL